MVIFYIHNPFQVPPLPLPFLLVGLIGVYGPTFAALIMTSIKEGRPEYGNYSRDGGYGAWVYSGTSSSP